MFTLNLRECREIYESHFSNANNQYTPMPNGLSFQQAAQQVYNAIGATEFSTLLEAVRELHHTEDFNMCSIGV
jgi:hypothetical protein